MIISVCKAHAPGPLRASSITVQYLSEKYDVRVLYLYYTSSEVQFKLVSTRHSLWLAHTLYWLAHGTLGCSTSEEESTPKFYSNPKLIPYLQKRGFFGGLLKHMLDGLKFGCRLRSLGFLDAESSVSRMAILAW